MSLFTPVKVPVKVYKWDDVDAPQLDKSAGCMMTIFKGCLVTGYGTKEAAGWTMPYEDLTAKVKVFRPTLSPDTDFYLRCSADNGTQMTSQVYLNMTAQNKGTLKLQCASAFKYARGSSSGKWIMIASPRGFWFFCEQAYADSNVNKTGAYFFCGDTTESSAGDKLVYMQHTGGAYTDGDYSSIMRIRAGQFSDSDENAYLPAKTLNSLGVVAATSLLCAADGTTVNTLADYTAPPIMFSGGELYMLPGLFLNLKGAAYDNFTIKQINQNAEATDAVVFGTAGHGDSNVYVSTDWWIY